MSVESLIPRHEGHDHSGPHYANIKYGYIALATASSLLLLATARTLVAKIVSSKSASRSRQGRQKKSGSRLLLLLLEGRVPLPVVVMFWGFFMILFCTVGLPEFTAKKLAKRAGRITYSMVPVILLLALRVPGNSVIITSYLDTLRLHKWIARVVLVSAAVHVVIYLAVYISTGRTDKIKKKDNLLGLVAAILMAVVGITSLKPVRRRVYRVFYFIHYPAAWAIVILIIFHARPGVLVLAIMSLSVLFVEALIRIWATKVVKAVSVTRLSPTLSVIVLPRRVLPNDFAPASHLRLGLHPYTIASLPSDPEVRLLVRDLSHPILPDGPAATETWLAVNGPYMPSGRASQLVREARKALIFAGGSGLSFAAGVARALEMRGAQVRVIWMVRRRDEITALGLLEVTCAEVYVTSNGGGNKRTGGGEEEEEERSEDPFDDEFELEELLDDDEDDEDVNMTVVGSTLTNGSGEEEGTLVSGGGPKGVRIHKGRPDFRLVAKEFFHLEGEEEEEESAGGVGGVGGCWVCACGPAGLVSQAKRWAGTYYDGVEFVGEEYVL
ncbi:uncharacterized protein SAPINGB_P003924 [Magnusiomyces paraingens]|uniref:Ferric oxidoreductase domain-containing protein n=1 Tax=Magnusiomyces paraingens TaxID=2606893 RepID=A0A5E8BZA3_9ASCO|nr:uncharacterized protein SAPINGB_P003924 [Saprochaete ingens]VVT54135.1 unnamed protein product [Saprochaete ingens]